MLIGRNLNKLKRFFVGDKIIEETGNIIFTKDLFSNKNYLIGEYTYGKPSILFDDSGAKLIIGKFCSIAGGVKIFLGGNHRTDWISTYPMNLIWPNNNITGHPATKGDVRIGNDVWIGLDATILSGISIGNGSVIAANSVVTSNIGDYEIWGGNPAKLIRKRFNQETINKLNKIKWWDWPIDKIEFNSHKLSSANVEEFINEAK